MSTILMTAGLVLTALVLILVGMFTSAYEEGKAERETNAARKDQTS